MNNFGLRTNMSVAPFIERKNEDLPNIIDGADLYDTVCPVSKETGLRENALTLLSKVLDPKQQRLIDSILQYVPTVQENPNISDDDALDMIVKRFDQGTPYENQLLRDRLERTLDILLPKQRQAVEGTIEFNPSDTPDISIETK